MRFAGEGASGVTVTVEPSDPNTVPESGGPWIEVSADSGAGNSVTVGMDENHASALALALQAAVAEIQARAVSR